MAQIDLSELDYEKLYDKSLIVLGSSEVAPWLGLRDKIFWNFTYYRFLENTILDVDSNI